MTTETYLTVRETARRLGLHENTVRNMTNDGRLPCVYPAGSSFRRIPESWINAAVRRREIQAQIYPDLPQTLSEVLADELARMDGVVVITRGTRSDKQVDAGILIGKVQDWVVEHFQQLPEGHHERAGLHRVIEMLKLEMH